MGVTMWGSSKVYTDGLNFLKTNANIVLVSNTKPTSTWVFADFKDASSSTGLWVAGSTIMASTDWAIAAGTISGHKVSMGASSNTNTMTVTGPTTKAGSVCVLKGNSTDNQLIYITSCSTVALSTSDQVTIPTWRIEIKAPTSS